MEYLLLVFIEHWKIVVLFFLVALLYSSVGFGGGSSYLAILALFSIDFQLVRIVALMCNIAVVTGGVFIFYQQGLIHWRRMWPLALLSVPFAYLGGSIPIKEATFFLFLSVTLIVAAVLMLRQRMGEERTIKPAKLDRVKSLGLGGSIGFLSGLVGIGGGIFLAPVLHLLKWDSAKIIAATASFFILVNSLAGLSGQIMHLNFDIEWEFVGVLVASVFLGGQIGSRLGSGPLSQVIVRKLTAVLILFVGFRIGFKYLVGSI